MVNMKDLKKRIEEPLRECKYQLLHNMVAFTHTQHSEDKHTKLEIIQVLCDNVHEVCRHFSTFFIWFKEDVFFFLDVVNFLVKIMAIKRKNNSCRQYQSKAFSHE